MHHFLVVDDDFNSRGGTAMTLGSMHPGCEVLQASGVREAVAVLDANRSVGLVLLDLNVDDSRGLDTLQTLKQWCEEEDCNPRIVVVSAGADYDERLIHDVIDHCATGFIAKGTAADVFRHAIELTLAGSIFVPEKYLRARQPDQQRLGAEVPFTPRERDVIDGLLAGLTYKQIARRLERAEPGRAMAENTVRVHVQRMAWKIKTSGEQQADDIPAKAVVLTYVAALRARSKSKTWLASP